jgi:hypothetical protein
MKSDFMQSKNRRGRPATGINPSVGVRIEAEQMAAIDRWRAAQSDVLTRPEAIRRLVDLGLSITLKRKSKR